MDQAGFDAPLPETMRAIRKVRPGEGADLVEVPVPRPGPAEVLIRVDAASICGTDLHIFRWDAWASRRMGDLLPLTFGHEVAGVVVATGPEVHHIRPGAFVSAEGHLYCGFCRLCRSGRAHICERLRLLGVDVDGAFAEYLALPERNTWEVDARIAPDVASIHDPFGNAVHTAFAGGAAELATASVAVLGCGPIGLFAVGICRAVGARQVVAVEPNEFRQSLAKQMGADVVVDPTREDPVEAVRAATDGAGAEVVLEMSGVPAVVAQGTRMLALGGRMALLGLPTEAVSLDLSDQVIFKAARLFGVTGREIFRTWQQATVLLATGMVDVGPVITHRFGLEAFDEAFETTASGRSGKVVLLPGGVHGGGNT
jgi:threonine 3-dehydrogenase